MWGIVFHTVCFVRISAHLDKCSRSSRYSGHTEICIMCKMYVLYTAEIMRFVWKPQRTASYFINSLFSWPDNNHVLTEVCLSLAVALILSDCTYRMCWWRPMATLCLITWAALTAEEDWCYVLHVSTHMDPCTENRISSQREWVSMWDVFHVVIRHNLGVDERDPFVMCQDRFYLSINNWTIQLTHIQRDWLLLFIMANSATKCVYRLTILFYFCHQRWFSFVIIMYMHIRWHIFINSISCW